MRISEVLLSTPVFLLLDTGCLVSNSTTSCCMILFDTGDSKMTKCAQSFPSSQSSSEHILTIEGQPAKGNL